jgi:hypothetical protein
MAWQAQDFPLTAPHRPHPGHLAKPVPRPTIRPATPRLLAIVAAQRELDSADSLAEIVAWRLDAYLADNQTPPMNDRPYEHVARLWPLPGLGVRCRAGGWGLADRVVCGA